MGRKEEGGHTHSRVKREALLPSYFFSTRRFFTLPTFPSPFIASCAQTLRRMENLDEEELLNKMKRTLYRVTASPRLFVPRN
jgi:hypothetical protein